MKPPRPTGFEKWLLENEPKAIEVLNRISDLSNTIQPAFDLRYASGNRKMISDATIDALQGRLTATGLDVAGIPFDAHRKAVFAQIYEIGSSSSRLARFRWTRATALNEALEVFRFSIERCYIGAAYLQARSVLEVCGNLAMLHKDIHKIDFSDVTKEQLSECMVAVTTAVNQRGQGTRLNWKNLASKGLVEGKSKSYVASADLQDISAVDLMASIDLLSKTVKGARHAYDYLSEYAHPNVGLIAIGLKSRENKVLPNGFELQFRTYSASSTGPITVDGSISLFVEILEILEAVLLQFIKLDKELGTLEKKVAESGKKLIRIGLRNHPELFLGSNPCPCFSGRIISACCGVAIRFG